MDAKVKHLLNTTLGGYQDEYRGNVRRIITGTLDECVRRGTLPRHTLTGIELGPRIVTAAQYEQEQQRKRLVHLPDETVAMLADGLTVTTGTKRRRTWPIPGLGIAPWLQRTMGLRIREALGVRKADFMTRADGTRYLHLCWQASPDGMELEPLKHRKAGEYRDVPVPDMVWDMVADLPDGPLCPGPKGTPYMPYNTAYSRFARLTGHLGISGAHTHMLRHQFATEALDENPRELANISQVLGHDSIETTLKFYIHPSADAEQRIGAMMNARWACQDRAEARDEQRSEQAHRSAGERSPDEQGGLASADDVSRQDDNPRAAARNGRQHRTRTRTSSRHGPAGTAPNGAGTEGPPCPPSRKPPPAAPSGHGRTRAEEQARHVNVNGRDKGAARSISGTRGSPQSPVPPGPPFPPQVAPLPGKSTP